MGGGFLAWYRASWGDLDPGEAGKARAGFAGAPPLGGF